MSQPSMLHGTPGVLYVPYVFPEAQAAADVTALVLTCPNPFNDTAYVESIEIISPSAVTGDSTNSRNVNVQTAAGTEIANLDLATGTDLVAGTAKALTITGSDANRTVAAGKALLVESQKVGTGLAIPLGSSLRVGWRGK